MHSAVLLHIFILGGLFTLRTKIFDPLVRSRSLGGPSTLWTCLMFYPIKGTSTTRTKIIELLVRSRCLSGPSTSRTKILEPLVWFIH